VDHQRAQVSGAALAAVPHVLILVLMGVEIARTGGTDRGYAALFGVLEIYVVPGALLVALLLRSSRRWRAVSIGVVAGTLVGAVLVLIATMAVGSGAMW
jgi:hypothetical protein